MSWQTCLAVDVKRAVARDTAGLHSHGDVAWIERQDVQSQLRSHTVSALTAWLNYNLSSQYSRHMTMSIDSELKGILGF